MAEEIKSKFRYDVDLERSSGGVFEVEKDGELIFSKKEEGRFPEPGEVAGKLKEKE